MKYYRHELDDYTKSEEITYDRALAILLTTYRDNDMTRDMLTIPNQIPCRYSRVSVRDGDMVSMAGLYCLLPMGNEYDEDGNRIE